MEPPCANAEIADRREAAVDWLMGRINFERVAVIPYNERQLKLDRMRQLLTRLGSPDAGLKIVHIAGTKGKGSTAAILAAMLTAAGIRTGVYSSPHVERIEERWAIDGAACSAEELVALVDRVRPVVEAMDAESSDIGPPTFFDITTAMALVYFAEQQCGAVVLEVGLGGRLDSTNVCLPIVSVITSISLDHTRQLGDTLAEIAGEKAGVIKPGVPVVSGVTPAEPREVIGNIARERGCRLIERDVSFGGSRELPLEFWREGSVCREKISNLTLGLVGAHQLENAAIALATIGELRDQGWEVSETACREGLATVRLPARVEWFAVDPGRRPAVVVDAAHNDVSAQALGQSLGVKPVEGPRTLIVAISREKLLAPIAAALAPLFDCVIATRYVENPRAADPHELAKLFSKSGAENVDVASDPATAWQAALQTTPEDGLIVITGSFFIAAELRPLVGMGR